MSEVKSCPFCLEEIPVRAIKCKYCESMVDDIRVTISGKQGQEQSQIIEEIPVRAIKCSKCESLIEDIYISIGRLPIQADAQVKSKKSTAAPSQEAYYQPYSEKKKSKPYLVPLIILVALFLALGAGAGYWFLLREDVAVQAGGEVASGDIIGSWSSVNAENEVYFQFLPNEMVNVAVVPEGYWFRTQYRLIKADNKSYLELYHQGLAKWDRNAELFFNGAGSLVMTDSFDGAVLKLERITDSVFREVITDLDFER
jgi:hypothetical protein